MLYTAILKEAKQLFSDKGFLLIALIQPIVFIIMFGSSFQGGDINHLDTIVIDQDKSNFSRYVTESTARSEFFNVVSGNYTLDEALLMLNTSEIRSVVFIPKGFEDNINNKKTGEIKVYIDSSNFLTYSSLSGAKIEIVKDTLQNVTKDILGDLEKEKEEGEGRIDEIKDIFNEVGDEAD
jgi:ABC-2 type transport system permease protein